MHEVSIEHTQGHNFTVTIDGVQASLSYKNVGGRKAVEALGAKGLMRLLDGAERTIYARNSFEGCRELFGAIGVSNAMAVLDVYCRDAFIAYWTNIISIRKQLGQGCSFRSVLAAVSGTKATLAQSNDPLVATLKRLCQERKDYLDMQTCPISFDEASGGDISAKLLRQNNNSLVFDLNGQHISLCTNRVGDIRSAADVLCAAHLLQKAVLLCEDLKRYAARWGGSFVFRILYVLCPTETRDYFCEYAYGYLSRRVFVDPRRILKDFGFPFNDRQLQRFCNDILSALERVRNDAKTALPCNNYRQFLTNNSRWTLFYDENSNLRYRRIDFAEIGQPELRDEAIQFLGMCAQSNGRMPVTQIARYFYLIRSGLNALAETGVSSIVDVAVHHVRFVKSHLQCVCHCSANHISEVMQAMGRMYQWASPQGNVEDNPFWNVNIPNKRAFLQTTQPASSDALWLINAHLEELPEYVQLGHRLLTATLARAHDIFSLCVSNLEIHDDGTGLLRFVSGKNGRQMLFSIPRDLMKELMAYIRKTTWLRKNSDSDYIFLYRSDRLRTGSERGPQLLTRTTYNYYIERLLNRYASPHHVTARQIRAEGGRRYYSSGMTSAQVAVALGNTPAVAKRHYRTLSPKDEAELFHRAYATYFAPLPGERSEHKSQSQLIWGSCMTVSCQHANHCQNCPYLLHTAEVNTGAAKAEKVERE